MLSYEYILDTFSRLPLLTILVCFSGLLCLIAIRMKRATRQQLDVVIDELRKARKIMAEVHNIEEVESECKLYIGNLDYDASEEDVHGLFKKYGEIEVVNIPAHKYTGKGRGFGFINFYKSKAAESALVLNGSDYRGRPIQVYYAKERC